MPVQETAPLCRVCGKPAHPVFGQQQVCEDCWVDGFEPSRDCMSQSADKGDKGTRIAKFIVAGMLRSVGGPAGILARETRNYGRWKPLRRNREQSHTENYYEIAQSRMEDVWWHGAGS